MNVGVHMSAMQMSNMGWLRVVGYLKLQVSFAKELYTREDYFAKETYNFKEPTTRSHPMVSALSLPHIHLETQRVHKKIIGLFLKNFFLFWRAVSFEVCVCV